MTEEEKDIREFEEWDKSLTSHILWVGGIEITPLRKEAFLAVAGR